MLGCRFAFSSGPVYIYYFSNWIITQHTSLMEDWRLLLSLQRTHLGTKK